MKYKLIILLLISNISLAQICRTEAEIPSTTPDSRFTDNGNGTISDSGTGLMWQKCQLGLSGSNCDSGNAIQYTWQQALEQADSSSVAGYSDWRLPNHKELLSIVEQRCFLPSINTTYFPNTSRSYFWSASPSAVGSSRAWYVGFYYGYSFSVNRVGGLSVRLVRFGQ